MRRKRWVDNIPESRWAENFHLFTVAKKLYLPGELAQCSIALVLRGVVEEGTTEVLPALQNLFLHSYLPRGPQAVGLLDSSLPRDGSKLSGYSIFVGF